MTPLNMPPQWQAFVKRPEARDDAQVFFTSIFRALNNGGDDDIKALWQQYLSLKEHYQLVPLKMLEHFFYPQKDPIDQEMNRINLSSLANAILSSNESESRSESCPPKIGSPIRCFRVPAEKKSRPASPFIPIDGPYR